MPTSKPTYPAEFRRQLVELVRAGRKPTQLAREFNVTAQSISTWVAQAAANVLRWHRTLMTLLALLENTQNPTSRANPAAPADVLSNAVAGRTREAMHRIHWRERALPSNVQLPNIKNQGDRSLSRPKESVTVRAETKPKVPMHVATRAAEWIARLYGPSRSRQMGRGRLAWQSQSQAHRFASVPCTATREEMGGVSHSAAADTSAAAPLNKWTEANR